MAVPSKITAILTARPGKAAELRALLVGMAPHCRAEPGNLRWDVWRDASNEDRYVLDELYRDAAAVEAHRSTPHFQAYLGKIPELADRMAVAREEDFLQDIPRQIAIARHKGRVEAGKIVAADLKLASTTPLNGLLERMGAPSKDPDAQLAAGHWNVYYDIPNFRATTYEARGLSPSTTWRSVGASTAGFFTESFIDELIHAAGLDPMQARIDMCTVPSYRKLLETVAEMSNWKGPLGNGKGRGVAFVESFGTPTAEVIEVTVTDKGIRIDKVWVAADVGKVVDPINFENQVQGGVIWGLGHAINCELTYANGAVQQTNYHHHEAMRIYQCPEIEVRGLENNPKVRGIGEPPVPPAAPALANAIFAATGKRIREMPFNKFIDFV